MDPGTALRRIAAALACALAVPAAASAALQSPVVAAQAPAMKAGWPIVLPSFGVRSSTALAVGRDGTVYLHTDLLRAINPDGTPRWAGDGGDGAPLGNPVVGPDGDVFAPGAKNGRVYRFHPDGTLVSRSDPVCGYGCSLLAVTDDGRYVFGGFDSRLGPGGIVYRAQDAAGADPAQVVAVAADGTARTLAVLSADPIQLEVARDGGFVVATESMLQAFGPDGAPRWSAPLSGIPTGLSIADDGTVLAAQNASSPRGRLDAFGPDGTLRWTFQAPGRELYAPAIGADGTIYAPSGNGTLSALAPDGRERWRVAVRGDLRSAVIAPDGSVLLAAGDGNLYALAGPHAATEPRSAVGVLRVTPRVFRTDGIVSRCPRGARAPCAPATPLGAMMSLGLDRAWPVEIRVRRPGSSRVIASAGPITAPAGALWVPFLGRTAYGVFAGSSRRRPALCAYRSCKPLPPGRYVLSAAIPGPRRETPGVTVTVVAAPRRPAPPPPTTSPRWSRPRSISGAPQAQNVAALPVIAMSPRGRAVAVWHLGKLGHFGFAVMGSVRTAPGVWTAPRRLDRMKTGGSDPEAVAVGGDGSAVAMWGGILPGTTTRVLRTASVARSARTFGPAASLSGTATYVALPHVGADAAGNAVAVWQEPGKVRGAARPAGGAWSAPEDVSTPGLTGIDADLAVSGSGTAVAVWTAFGPATIVAASVRPPGGPWQPAEPLASPGTYSGDERVAVNAAGDALAVWVQTSGADNALVAADRPAGGAWTPPQRLAALGQSFRIGDVALDAAGGAVVEWRSLEDGHYVVQVATRPAAGAAWSAPAALLPKGVTQSAGEPAVVMNGRGDATLVWVQKGLRAAFMPHGGRWTPVELVAPAATGLADPGASIDAAGRVVAVWSRSDNLKTVVESSERSVR